jgi:hypothetical protein
LETAPKKYLARSKEWNWKSLGVRDRIYIYNTYVASTLSFVAQYFDPTQEVLRAEEAVLYAIMGGPANSVRKEELWTLKDSYHFFNSAVSIGHLARAAKLRVFHWENRREGGLNIKRDLDEMQHAASIHHYLPLDAATLIWWHQSVQHSIWRAHQHLSSEGITLATITKTLYKSSITTHEQVNIIRKRTQRTAMTLSLRKLHQGQIHLRRRMAKWTPVGNLREITSQCGKYLGRLRKVVPPRVHAAILATIMNRWCTTRRTQQNHAPHPCLLCGWEEGDDVRHYGGCQRVKELYKRLCGDATNNLFSTWIGVSRGSDKHTATAALCCYAAYRTTNALRASGGAVDTRRLLWQAAYMGQKGAPRLRNLYSQTHARKKRRLPDLHVPPVRRHGQRPAREGVIG